MDLVPLDLLERDWQRELAGDAVSRHLREWQRAEPALAPFRNASALIRFLRESASGDRQDMVLAALLRRAREDPIAARLVLQRLLPGLKRRAKRLILDAADREEFWSVLLALTWERIRTFPIQRLPHQVAAALVLGSVRDTVRMLTSERAASEQDSIQVADEQPGDDPGSPALGVDALLARAVRAGAISAAEAELILETRIDGIAPARAAAERGVSSHALVVRRLRAEQRLFMHLGYRGVTYRGSFWPLCGARVSGAGSLGLAGGEDQSTPPRR